MLRELRRPAAIPDYIDKDKGRYDRAMYENENAYGTRRYYEQVYNLKKNVCLRF